MKPSHGLLPALLIGFTLMSLTGTQPLRRTSRGSSFAPDSATVRIAFKSSGGETEQCSGLNWGWDSLTWRIRLGDPVPHRFMFAQPEFRLGRTSRDGFLWLLYRARYVVLGRWPVDASSRPEWDSILVSSEWSPMLTTTGVEDAEMWFRVRVVSPWPEPASKRIGTTTLWGKVIDDSTGCAVFFCQVVVDGTKLTTHADTLGRFVLQDVPTGKLGIDACAFSYLSAHAEVNAPENSLVIRLKRDPRIGFTRPCRRE